MSLDEALAVRFAEARDALDACNTEALQVPIGFLTDLSQASTTQEVLSAYSVWSQQIVGADRCTIALQDGADSLALTAMTGEKGLRVSSRFDLQTTIVGAVFRRQSAVFLPDLSAFPSPGLIHLDALGFQAVVMVPIVTSAKCFGVLTASFRSQVDQPGDMLSKLQAISRCIAMQLQVVDQMNGLSQMAKTDALTGAGNRYALYEVAETAWAAWKKGGPPFSYMSMDIDYFKQINDTYGHDIGDAVLCAFVSRVAARSRVSDGIMRTGGEEFGMLLADTRLPLAAKRASRLCLAIGDHSFSVADIELHVTASFGVTEVQSTDASFDDVLKRADRALYAAKDAGRDQVVVLDEQELAA